MTHTHTNGRRTSVRGKRAPLAATAAAAAAVVVVVLAGTAHAQADQSTVFSTSASIASGKEGFVLTDTFADVDIEGDVDAPGLAAAGAVAEVVNADGFGQAFSQSLAGSDEDFPVAEAFTGAFAYGLIDAYALAGASADPEPANGNSDGAGKCGPDKDGCTICPGDRCDFKRPPGCCIQGYACTKDLFGFGSCQVDCSSRAAPDSDGCTIQNTCPCDFKRPPDCCLSGSNCIYGGLLGERNCE